MIVQRFSSFKLEFLKGLIVRVKLRNHVTMRPLAFRRGLNLYHEKSKTWYLRLPYSVAKYSNVSDLLFLSNRI